MTTPKTAFSALQAAIGEDRIATQRAVMRLHDAGYVLTPLVPEVPPRRDGREAVEAQITGLLSINAPLSPIERGNLGAYQDVLNLIDRLAATRTPEPPDSREVPLFTLADVIEALEAVEAFAAKRGKATLRDEAYAFGLRGAAGIVASHLYTAHPSLDFATWSSNQPTPEPPDSGDGAARSRSVIRRENVQAGRPMNEGIEPPDSGDGARCRDLGYEAHAWVNTGSPSICRDCGMTFPRFDRLRLRSGSPAPEGGE